MVQEPQSDLVTNCIRASIALVILFFGYLLSVLVLHPRIFGKRHGRAHSLIGLAYLLWMLLGIAKYILSFLQQYSDGGSDIVFDQRWFLGFDIVLGLLGIALPLTAAYEFKHHGIQNVASGTLDEHATVTHGEMIEHAFYQGVNLFQILFLHSCYWLSIHSRYFSPMSQGVLTSFGGFPSMADALRCILLVAVTSPWLVRHRFPINKFSDNYNKIDSKSSALIRALYRIKKYQYVFYKHFLLHGLNITAVLLSDSDLVTQSVFRLYWLLLNTSYVMEFFLQTLVKKKYMKQSTMLGLQHVLMAASSAVAVFVLQHVNVYAALASLSLNFLNRKFDFVNTMLIYSVSLILQKCLW